MNSQLSEIAQRVLGLETLEARHSDRLDFHDLSVFAVKEALEQAFKAGQAAAVTPCEPHAGGYAGYRDYTHLVQLVRNEEVICLVDYRVGQKTKIRDVAKATCRPHGAEEIFQIVARGIIYVHAFDEADFIAQCQVVNVEYLLPSGSLPPGSALCHEI